MLKITPALVFAAAVLAGCSAEVAEQLRAPRIHSISEEKVIIANWYSMAGDPPMSIRRELAQQACGAYGRTARFVHAYRWGTTYNQDTHSVFACAE